MAIRLVHQPIGILGLSAYAAARGRRKYPTLAPRGGAGRAGALPQGRFVNPLAALAPPAADPLALKGGAAPAAEATALKAGLAAPGEDMGQRMKREAAEDWAKAYPGVPLPGEGGETAGEVAGGAVVPEDPRRARARPPRATSDAQEALARRAAAAREASRSSREARALPKTERETEREAEREAEAERRRSLITQGAQYQAAARAGRMGRKYHGNLLPYFVPQEEIDRRQELADEERDRAFTIERDEAGRAFARGRDSAGFARDDMKERRRAVEREAGSLTIPDWVSPRDRIELEKRKTAVGEFARPDVDLTDPAAGEAYAGALDSYQGYLEGLKPPDPTEKERANTYYRDRTTGEVLDGYREGAVPFDSRTGRPIDLPPAQKDLAAEQAAEQAAAYQEYEDKRYDYWSGQEVDDQPATPEWAAERARQDAEQMRRRRGVPPAASPELDAMRAMAQSNQGAQQPPYQAPPAASPVAAPQQQPISQPQATPQQAAAPPAQGLSERTRRGLEKILRETQEQATTGNVDQLLAQVEQSAATGGSVDENTIAQLEQQIRTNPEITEDQMKKAREWADSVRSTATDPKTMELIFLIDLLTEDLVVEPIPEAPEQQVAPQVVPQQQRPLPQTFGEAIAQLDPQQRPLPPGFPAGSQWVNENIIRLPDGTFKRRKGG